MLVTGPLAGVLVFAELGKLFLPLEAEVFVAGVDAIDLDILLSSKDTDKLGLFSSANLEDLPLRFDCSLLCFMIEDGVLTSLLLSSTIFGPFDLGIYGIILDSVE